MVLQQEHDASASRPHDQLLEALQEVFYIINLLSYVLEGESSGANDVRLFLEHRKYAVDFGRPSHWRNAGARQW